MAEKIEEEQSASSKQNLTCPLCLDIFDDATILTSCGHTFCRKCLKNYDLTYPDIDHMVCPLCRTITNLSSNRIDDLLTNATVNGLVDDYYVKSGGVHAVREKRPNCTTCKLQCEAVSFCRTCNNYMCDKCSIGHEQLTLFFEGHEIISIQNIIQGDVGICQYSAEKCFIHKHENKDMFCEDCKVPVHHKCLIVGHQNHKIKNLVDFEQDLRLKMNDLIQHCTAKKSELEKNIENVEAQRHEVHTFMLKLQEDVVQAYNIKAKRLDQNQRTLIDEIDELKRSFNDDLYALKSINRQRIKRMCSSMTLADNARLGRLEMDQPEVDSLSAHTSLDDVPKEATAAVAMMYTNKKKVKLADDSSQMDVQYASEADQGVTQVDTSDHTSAAAEETANTRRFMSAEATGLDLGNISETDPELQVIQCVDLRGWMNGMTLYSDDSVAVTYGYSANGIDIINLAGNMQQYTNIPSDVKGLDLVFQQGRSVWVSTGNEAHEYSSRGSRTSTIRVKGNEYSLKLNRSPSDEIIVTYYHGKQVNIYDPTGTTLRRTLRTEHETWQASATSSGLIVTSSCDYNPSMMTIYGRDGNAGESLQAPSDVYLYAAVDEQDRVYVASVDCKSSKVVIRLYDIDGLNLKERVQFSTLNLKLGRSWCYLICLSPELLAFGCDKKLYFFKISH